MTASASFRGMKVKGDDPKTATYELGFTVMLTDRKVAKEQIDTIEALLEKHVLTLEENGQTKLGSSS